MADGLTKLNNEGVKPLTQGANKLNSVVGELSVGAGKLKEGADKLASGSKELDENMKKFDKEGIQKISSKIDSKMGSLQDIIDVKDELVKISNNYGTFSGVGDNMDGKVKFVMKTDEIKVKIAEVKEEKEIVKEEKKGFFGWIKNLFSSNIKQENNKILKCRLQIGIKYQQSAFFCVKEIVKFYNINDTTFLNRVKNIM